MFSETVHNQMFKVEYHLEVYVKHQSKLEFGKGNAVDFPILIRNQSQPIPFLQDRMQQWQRQEGVPMW